MAKTRLRRRRRIQLFPRRAPESEIPDPGQRADVQADHALRQEEVQRALGRISPKYREIVIFFDIQELTYEEICRITGVRMGTVKSRLNRGRAQLREFLKDFYYG